MQKGLLDNCSLFWLFPGVSFGKANSIVMQISIAALVFYCFGKEFQEAKTSGDPPVSSPAGEAST